MVKSSSPLYELLYSRMSHSVAAVNIAQMTLLLMLRGNLLILSLFTGLYHSTKAPTISLMFHSYHLLLLHITLLTQDSRPFTERICSGIVEIKRVGTRKKNLKHAAVWPSVYPWNLVNNLSSN